MRTFARTVLVFGGLCLTAGAARAQSMDILHQEVPERPRSLRIIRLEEFRLQLGHIDIRRALALACLT